MVFLQKTPSKGQVTPYQGSILSTNVGPLQAKWHFPSDHLPIGATVNQLGFASWNVLNTAYIEWIYKNGQGLNGSMITRENVPIQNVDIPLTVRELHTVTLVVQILESHTLISLQECGGGFLKMLEKKLPRQFQIIPTTIVSQKNQNVVVHDRSKLTYQAFRSKVTYPYKRTDPERPLLDLVFSAAGQTFRVINPHVPGDPQNPGVVDLGKYLAQELRMGEVTLCLGDYNFNATETIEAFSPISYPYSLVSPYPTNVGDNLHSKCIDHIFVHGTSTITPTPPDTLLRDLSRMVKLLT